MLISDSFLLCSYFISFIMLVWACVEVGSNDAANLVNAVAGAQILKRKMAVYLASFFVIIGAMSSGMVMDTVRKGIFDIHMLTSYQMIAIFLAAYFVNTIILFVCSCYGLPVSTTATLVFSLAGGALGVLWNTDVIQWGTLGKVGSAMLLSILFAGVFGYLMQRIFRRILGHNARDINIVKQRGPFVGSVILSLLSWFILVKGFRSFLKLVPDESAISLIPFLGLFWFIGLKVFISRIHEDITRYLFDGLAVIGMLSMAFAFGQNDLANCASPGLAIMMLTSGDMASTLPVPWWALLLCGFLIGLGMHTQRAQRVTRAEINTASQHQVIHLYAPKWCLKVVRLFSSKKDKKQSVSQPSSSSHYDSVRACVILTVSASVIVAASSLGLPVSTTYVSFAAVIASGWGDNIFHESSAEQKLGRSIWVVTCWVLSIIAAIIFGGIAAFIIDEYEISGILLCFTITILVQVFFRIKGDHHNKKIESKNESDEVFSELAWTP